MSLNFMPTEFMKILDRLFPAQGILTDLICVFFFVFSRFINSNRPISVY